MTGYHRRWRTPEEVALLGTAPDEVIAVQVGKTVTAVRVKKQRVERS